MVKRKYPFSSYGNASKRIRTAGPSRSLVSAGMSAIAPYVARSAGPYATAAYTGYQLARTAYGLGKRMFGSGPAKKIGGRRYVTKGRYLGKIRKPTRRRMKSSVDTAAKRGFVYNEEISGTVSDPDCVYVTANAISSYNAVVYSVQALIRKLFLKSGLRINDKAAEIGNTSFDNSAGFRVQLIVLNVETDVTSVGVTYTTVDNDSCETIALQFTSTIMQYSAGYSTTPGVGNASNAVQPILLQLYNSDYNVSQGFQIKCELDLRQEMIHCKALTNIKIQNRTKSSTGSSDAEDVNNNPLQGRVYQFNNSPRTVRGSLLEDVRVDSGVQLVRAAQMDSSFKEPPLPKFFWNCKKASSIRLDPGAIKRGVVKYNKSMPYLMWLKNVRLAYSTSATFYESQKNSGPCLMFSLEDVINVNASENISIAYEVNRQVGVYFTTKAPIETAAAYSYTALSNNAS